MKILFVFLAGISHITLYIYSVEHNEEHNGVWGNFTFKCILDALCFYMKILLCRKVKTVCKALNYD